MFCKPVSKTGMAEEFAKAGKEDAATRFKKRPIRNWAAPTQFRYRTGTGFGTEQNIAPTRDWYDKAAKQDTVTAGYSLATAHPNIRTRAGMDTKSGPTGHERSQKMFLNPVQQSNRSF